VTVESLEARVRAILEADEAKLPGPKRPSSLAAHAERVARIARRLALAEPGTPPGDAYLAGLLHDAGKFRGGRYHHDEVTEEEESAEVAGELLGELGYPVDQIRRVQDAIRVLYRDDLAPTPLTAIVHDADNLDKLGPHGVAGFFVKAGLRGRGLDEDLVMQLGVELTHARYAADMMLTDTGEARAVNLARQTEEQVLGLLESLRSELGWKVDVRPMAFQDLEIIAVVPRACGCDADARCELASEPSLKCTMLRIDQTCGGCGRSRTLRFCCPRVRRR
jgi:HD superfamily phosphodiesterase